MSWCCMSCERLSARTVQEFGQHFLLPVQTGRPIFLFWWEFISAFSESSLVRRCWAKGYGRATPSLVVEGVCIVQSDGLNLVAISARDMIFKHTI